MTAIDTQQVCRVQRVARHPPVYLDIDRAIGYVGDEAAARDLLQMVERSLGNDMDKISRSLAMSDVAAAGRGVHAIKGFAPIFCCNALVDQVIQVEAMTKAGAAESVRTAFADLAPVLLALLEEIRVYLSPPCTAALDGGNVSPSSNELLADEPGRTLPMT